MPHHGIEQHFVRPDRVYATGVWTPIVGYQPAEAANQVAARFVSGGQGLGMFSGGLGSSVHLLGRSILMRGPGATFWSWFREKVANVRVRMQVMAINRDLWKQRVAGALPPGLVHAPGRLKKLEADTSPRIVGPMTSGDQSPLLMTPAGAAATIQRGSVMSEEKTSAPPLGMALRQNVVTVNDANAYWRGVINSSSSFRMPGAGY
jgi:hypothetical protein